MRRLAEFAALVAVVGILSLPSDHGDDVSYVPFSSSVAKTPQRATSCDRVAGLRGRDTNPGTRRRPYRTVRRLLDSLVRGRRVGCLRRGTYRENVSVSRSGVTLTSHPGERATIVGRFRIRDSANHVTVIRLNLDGRNSSDLPSPSVYGDDAVFRHLDVTNRHSDICFLLGSSHYGRAYRTVISHSRIHDCGELPATNLDHGIYVSTSTRGRILNNLIYDNADRGIKLGPDAQGTLVRGNVIDGNGEGVSFSGKDGVASSNNVVQHNVIANSKLRWNVEGYWPSDTRPGTGNLVRRNCVWATGADEYQDNGGIAKPKGFTAKDNLIAEPHYADRKQGHLRLRRHSRCLEASPKRPRPPRR